MDLVNFFTQNLTLFLILIGLLGLIVGSFLNVVVFRLPQMMERSWSEECRIYLGLKPQTDYEKLNLYLPLSHCPQCKTKIKPWHNIPVLSYLWLRGHCAYCKGIISLRYPLVEILTCLMSLYVAWRFGVSWQTVGGLFFTWIGLCLTFIDLDHHLLPDQLTLSLLWLGLFLSLFNIFCTPQDAILGAIIGYLIFALTQLLFQWATGKMGMGQGDYKFLAALGGFLGWQMLPLIILLASICGVIFAFTHMLIKRQYKSIPLPFGPYLALAGWVALIWGKEIMQIYLDSF